MVERLRTTLRSPMKKVVLAYCLGLSLGFAVGRQHHWQVTPQGWGWVFAVLPIVLLLIWWFYIMHQLRKIK